MHNRKELKFHHEHAWAEILGEKAVLGISEYAQNQLGEVVYIDLPDLGTRIVKGTEICEIESTKAVSSFVAPLSGKIIEVNESLRDAVHIVNESPCGNGWIVVIEIDDLSECEDLLSMADYHTLVKGE